MSEWWDVGMAAYNPLAKLHEATSEQQNSHPDGIFIIAGQGTLTMPISKLCSPNFTSSEIFQPHERTFWTMFIVT